VCREAGGTQDKSRSLGPATHPLSPFSTKEVKLQSSWDVPSVNSEVLHSAWIELDENEMKRLFQAFNFMVVVASIGQCSSENAEGCDTAHCCDGCLVTTSHSRTVLSSEPVTMRVPSGKNETELTESVCPRKGSPTGCPVAASHSRTVLSLEPATMRVPSGENETELTERVCPRKGSP
jgi:hypothetical protein